MKTFRRWAFVVVVALSVSLTSLSSARADAKLLPVGSVIKTPGGGKRLLKSVHFLLPRNFIDRMNATATLSKKLTGELKKCADDNRKLARKESGWVTAVRWSVLGLVAGAAFTAGALAGK